MIEATSTKLSNKITREINKAAAFLKTGSLDIENDNDNAKRTG